MALSPDLLSAIKKRVSPYSQRQAIEQQLSDAINHPGSRVGQVCDQINRLSTEMAAVEVVKPHEVTPLGYYSNLPPDALKNARIFRRTTR